MGKDFTKVLQKETKKEAQAKQPEKARVSYNGPHSIILEKGVYYYSLIDTEELRELEEKGVIIETPKYTQEELKKMYEDQEAKKNTTKELDNILNSIENRLHGTDAKDKLEVIKLDPEKLNFSFKASKEVLLDLRALSVKLHKTQAEIIEDALIMYFENNLELYKQVLELRKAFNI